MMYVLVPISVNGMLRSCIAFPPYHSACYRTVRVEACMDSLEGHIYRTILLSARPGTEWSCMICTARGDRIVMEGGQGNNRMNLEITPTMTIHIYK